MNDDSWQEVDDWQEDDTSELFFSFWEECRDEELYNKNSPWEVWDTIQAERDGYKE